ncbi:MAG: hypothetical protein HZC03_01815 [Candidatus Lloydbacteria bacterium]|nr:hypothetical protein [Candidatus Lloydbacteria bacterium]
MISMMRSVSPWLCLWIFIGYGCSVEKYVMYSDSTKRASQTLAHDKDKEAYTEEDPFEKEKPSVECFENEAAIKKANQRLEKARDSFLAALSLPSFSFFILENGKTGEQKTVFAENHRLPPPFNDAEAWSIIKETPVGIKTIVVCALMLELQKF